MGVAEILLRKHTAIAKVLVPCSVGYGFLYTVQHNSNPLVDAKNSVLGKHPCLSTAVCLIVFGLFLSSAIHDRNLRCSNGFHYEAEHDECWKQQSVAHREAKAKLYMDTPRLPATF